MLDQVDSFFTTAQREGLLDSALVAYTADHGEALGERNYWFQHGNGIHPALVHVPLVVVPPGTKGRKADDRPVSHLDLLPTILSFLGTPLPSNVVGIDLLERTSNRQHPILTESTFLRNRVEVGIWLDDALVVRSAFAPPVAYWRTPAGWAESVPDESLSRRAGEALRPHVHRIQTVTPRQQKLSDEELKMLRSLGYLGGS